MRLGVLLLLLATGCQFADRHAVLNPGTDQVIEVKSGDRLAFELDEEKECEWFGISDDSDVDILYEHTKPGKITIRIYINRGYDGPSTVNFRCLRGSSPIPIKHFTLTLFKRTGDYAFWEY